jgi:hypothetical protein
VKHKLLWILPLALFVGFSAVILALPGYVASATHRTAIEALASSLTGRQVQIAGKLSLDMFPNPQLIAGRITLTGPDQETITARSLTLDIAPAALLRGQISVQTLTLDQPVIAFPWPLPGGAAAIAPPVWLAALHAQIHRGTVSIGAARFTQVEADVFTGSHGAVTMSGTATIFGQNADLSFALGGTQPGSPAPLSMNGVSGPLAGHFSGTLSDTSRLTGQAEFSAPHFSLSSNVTASGHLVTFSTLGLTALGGEATGHGTLSLSPLALALNLDAHNLDLSGGAKLLNYAGKIPLSLNLASVDATFYGKPVAALQTRLDAGPGGVTIQGLQATLAGNSSLSGSLNISSGGAINGMVHLESLDLGDLCSSYGITAPTGLSRLEFSARIGGVARQIQVTLIQGSANNDSVTGGFVITGSTAVGALHLSQINLLPAISWLRQQLGTSISVDGELTADHASIGAISLDNLLIDAEMGDGLNIRRASAQSAKGIIAGSLSINAAGLVNAAHGFLALPSASQLGKLIPTGWEPPPPLLQPRLNLNVGAKQTGNAIGVSAVATLGDFTITAAPVIDLASSKASGAVSFRHPNAIVALSLFGLNRGLAFPGAGSISLRAGFQISPQQFGLPDFVLSLGQTVASGRLMSRDGVITGNVAADTLDLPPVSQNIHIPWSSPTGLRGHVTMTVKNLLFAGVPVLQDVVTGLSLTPKELAITLPQASLGGGPLSGNLAATLSPTQPPALFAQFTAKDIDAAALHWSWPLPYSVLTGSLDISGSLTANGFTPKIWLATLGGQVDFNATNGTLSGFSLSGLSAALGSRERREALNKALATGDSAFDQLRIIGAFDQGNCTVALASLTGASGQASATGSLDLFDRSLALQLLLNPSVQPPLSFKTVILGSFETPKRFTRLNTAMNWRAASDHSN